MRVAKRSVCGIFAVDYGSYGRGNSRKAESSGSSAGGGMGGMGGGRHGRHGRHGRFLPALAPCGTTKPGVTPGFFVFQNHEDIGHLHTPKAACIFCPVVTAPGTALPKMGV